MLTWSGFAASGVPVTAVIVVYSDPLFQRPDESASQLGCADRQDECQLTNFGKQESSQKRAAHAA